MYIGLSVCTYVRRWLSTVIIVKFVLKSEWVSVNYKIILFLDDLLTSLDCNLVSVHVHMYVCTNCTQPSIIHTLVEDCINLCFFHLLNFSEIPLETYICICT